MSEVPASDAARVTRERLSGLAASGARAHAPSAYSFVESLLTRGEAMGGAGGQRLVGRALARAEALGQEWGKAKQRATDAVSDGDDPSGTITRAIGKGEVAPALRVERRRRLLRARSSDAHATWVARLEAEMKARAIPYDAEAPKTPNALASALYATSRAELSAMLVAIHAQAEVHFHAGPYNPVAIAARALGELSTLAPAYLTALVAYLDELAPLLSLPSPEAPPPDRPSSHAPARRKKPSKRPE